MAKNLFLHLCEALHIPHTHSYTNRQFDEHPYKNTLYGLHRLLAEYGVESEGIRFSDKEEALASVCTPFVAQVSNDLAVVTSLTEDEVTYTFYDDTLHVSRDVFLSQWSGVALLVSPTPEASEPHYEEHRNATRIQNTKRWCAIGSAATCLVCILWLQASHLTPFHLIALLLNLLGCYVCYLLLRHQLKMASATTDRLCSLLKRASCTDVLDSPAAIAAFGISWSEVGATYFAVNSLTLLTLPSLMSLLSCLGITALGYILWSLWYQRYRARSWCVLCLLVQAVFVLQAIVAVAYLWLQEARLRFIPCALYFALLALSLLALHLALPFVKAKRQARQWRSSLYSFKLKREVFDALLQKEKSFEPEAAPAIRFGNPVAPYRLTILTNPYCNPCAVTHAHLSGIPQTDCCVEMVFSSFGVEYDRTCLWLIAAYQQLGADRAWTLYEEWYAGGKARQEAFFEGLGLNPDSKEAAEEYARHQEWRKQTGFGATPTILVNGHRLPTSYQIEDFINLMKLEL